MKNILDLEVLIIVSIQLNTIACQHPDWHLNWINVKKRQHRCQKFNSSNKILSLRWNNASFVEIHLFETMWLFDTFTLHIFAKPTSIRLTATSHSHDVAVLTFHCGVENWNCRWSHLFGQPRVFVSGFFAVLHWNDCQLVCLLCSSCWMLPIWCSHWLAMLCATSPLQLATSAAVWHPHSSG